MNPHFTTNSKYFSDPEIFTTNDDRPGERSPD